MIIRIGKANDNDFVVNDVHVSRYHARLIRDENGRLFIEDTDSANGTYVNGDRVIKKRVTPSDVIMLGDHYVLEIQAVLKSDNDYSEEFAALKPVYERYIKEKIRIGLCADACENDSLRNIDNKLRYNPTFDVENRTHEVAIKSCPVAILKEDGEMFVFDELTEEELPTLSSFCVSCGKCVQVCDEKNARKYMTAVWDGRFRYQ